MIEESFRSIQFDKSCCSYQSPVKLYGSTCRSILCMWCEVFFSKARKVSAKLRILRIKCLCIDFGLQ